MTTTTNTTAKIRLRNFRDLLEKIAWLTLHSYTFCLCLFNLFTYEQRKRLYLYTCHIDSTSHRVWELKQVLYFTRLYILEPNQTGCFSDCLETCNTWELGFCGNGYVLTLDAQLILDTLSAYDIAVWPAFAHVNDGFVHRLTQFTIKIDE